MMRCKDVADQASDYVNRDLSFLQRWRIRWHLTMCEICRRYVDQMRNAVALLRRLGRNTEAPSDDEARTLFRSVRKKD